MINFLIRVFYPSSWSLNKNKFSPRMQHQQNRSPKFETEIASHVTPIFYRQKTWTREGHGRNLAGRISRNSAGSPPFVSFVPAPLGLFLRADETRYYGCVSRFIPVSISRLADKRPATLIPPPRCCDLVKLGSAFDDYRQVYPILRSGTLRNLATNKNTFECLIEIGEEFDSS